MITVKRRRWGRHYRIVVYKDGKVIATTKWSPKEGKTVTNIRRMLQETPSQALTLFAFKSRMNIARAIAEMKVKETEREILKYKSVYVDWIFKDWFTTTDPRKNKITRISYQVSFTTHEDAEFHRSNYIALADKFTDELRDATMRFIEEVLARMGHLAKKVDGSCSIEDEDWRRPSVPHNIELEGVRAEFKVEKGGRIYDYSFDYEHYIKDVLEDVIAWLS